MIAAKNLTGVYAFKPLSGESGKVSISLSLENNGNYSSTIRDGDGYYILDSLNAGEFWDFKVGMGSYRNYEKQVYKCLRSNDERIRLAADIAWFASGCGDAADREGYIMDQLSDLCEQNPRTCVERER